jgi:hypothetical protein
MCFSKHLSAVKVEIQSQECVLFYHKTYTGKNAEEHISIIPDEHCKKSEVLKISSRFLDSLENYRNNNNGTKFHINLLKGVR